MWRDQEISERKALTASIAFQSALPRMFLAAVCSGGSASGLQVKSRTRVRPSPRGISSGCQLGRWSKSSGAEFDGFRGRLNQSRFGSSSGIHSLTACQGGSMGSMVSMSKGGGGGRGRWMMVEDVDGLLRGPGCDLGRGFHLVPRLLDPVADGLQDWVTDGVTLSDLAPDSTRTATVDRISPRRFLKLVVAQTP